MAFCLIAIIIVWVYPRKYFHPTVPLPHMVTLQPLNPTIPSTSSVSPSAIIPHDMELETHSKNMQLIFPCVGYKLRA